MREFVQRLRSAWLYLRFTPYVDAADQEDAWTAEDGRAYAQFMRSPTGQKLAMRGANLATKSAVNATRATTTNQTYACAWANGVAATFTWLDGHTLKQETPAEAIEKLPDFMEQFQT